MINTIKILLGDYIALICDQIYIKNRMKMKLAIYYVHMFEIYRACVSYHANLLQNVYNSS